MVQPKVACAVAEREEGRDHDLSRQQNLHAGANRRGRHIS